LCRVRENKQVPENILRTRQSINCITHENNNISLLLSAFFLFHFSFLHVSSKIFNSVPPTNTRVCKNYRSATEKQNGSDSYKDFGDFLPTVKAIKVKYLTY
jgi:hypothetical protein